MTKLTIRPYSSSDRPDLFRIAGDTAFFGAPIEAYMEDRNVFLDAFYSYYTDLEPEHAWVACAGGEVAGFLAGCVDSSHKEHLFVRRVLPKLILNVFSGKYHFGKRSFKYIGGLLVGLLRREFTNVDVKIYPAHLHINVDAAWRGQHLGQRLMETYISQLRQLGVNGVFLDTTSQNEAACRMYEKIGFRLLNSSPDRFWTRWFGHLVENRCYGLLLGDKK
jgi:ribosomal protein S18 acetylase RimI-like enzyme